MFNYTHLMQCLTGFGITLVVLLGHMGSAAAQFSFGEPENLGPTVNSVFLDGGPNIATDGLTLFFHSDRPGGQGGADLWLATRADAADPWDPPVNLGSTVNGSYEDNAPDISADGLTIIFSSDRPGDSGDFDLWVTCRATLSDPWAPPVNLGPTINTSSHDGGPAISADGLTLFLTFRAFDGSAWDLRMTTRATVSDPWDPPVLLPDPVTTAFHERAPAISADGRALFFRSDRPGGCGGADLWQVAVFPDCFGDLDGDGEVDLSDLAILLAGYGSCDGDPFYDPVADFDESGCVDLADLAFLLADYGCGT